MAGSSETDFDVSKTEMLFGVMLLAGLVIGLVGLVIGSSWAVYFGLILMICSLLCS